MAARVRSADVAAAQRLEDGYESPDRLIPPGAHQIRPQAGPQTKFSQCGADIAIYGGSAGSGKTYALELEPLKYCTNVEYEGYSCVIFRRSIPAIRNPGSLWDQSFELYQEHGGESASSTLEWKWPGAGKIKFAHLEYETTVFDWHASQITLICFDELTEFTQKQFFYMLSRNRSKCGVRPYFRATCNPDADSWVAEFISWWIDPETGFFIPERSGKVRFFVRVGDDLRWANHPEDLTHELLGIPRFAPDGTEIPIRPMSVTFIGSSIYDNKELLKSDPDYLAKLLSLPTVERERLLNGNWKIKPAPGLFFNRAWVEIVDELPNDLQFKRGWDLAATEKTQGNNPDATSSTKIGKDIMKKIYYVTDSTNLMGSPYMVDTHIKVVSGKEGEGGDGPTIEQWFPQDPGQAGKSQMKYFQTMLDGVPVRSTPEVGDKITRFSPFSATAQAGRVKILRGPWNNRWFANLEAFPDPKSKDDDVDSTSRAFNSFLDGTNGLIEYYQMEAQKQAQDALARTAAETPTKENGIYVIAPNDGVNSLYDMKGRLLMREEDGTFLVTRAHGELLVGKSQFRYAPAKAKA